MISSRMTYTQLDVGYTIYKFENFFTPHVLNQLIIELAKHPYKLTSGDRTETDGPRIWGHQVPGILQQVSEFFAHPHTKLQLGKIMDFDFSNCFTRVELCMDKEGTWLRKHVDDAAKQLVLQIYLSDSGKSTLLGNDQLSSKLNTGWAFINTHSELHELPPLASQRASLIINYVDSAWRDKSVLVEG